MAFQPKQITHYNAEHLSELQGDVSEQAIQYSLSLLSPFKNGDIIHDNACGSGAVTETIMQQNPPSVRLQATDINPQFVQGVAELAKKHVWPVNTATMSSQEITFPDDSFTHSFTSFAFHCIGDHDLAAKQVYRTLKPGGIAIASVWTYMPHVEALQHAHWLTRGTTAPLPTLLPLESFQEAELQKTLKAGGFQSEKITLYSKECHLKVPDLERWAQLAWSYLGSLPSGWSQDDEEKWDEAITDIVHELKKSDGIEIDKHGCVIMKMTACIAIAEKEIV